MTVMTQSTVAYSFRLEADGFSVGETLERTYVEDVRMYNVPLSGLDNGEVYILARIQNDGALWLNIDDADFYVVDADQVPNVLEVLPPLVMEVTVA